MEEKQLQNNMDETPEIPDSDLENKDEIMVQEADVVLRTQVDNPDVRVLGVSLLGRSHQQSNKPCQDYHLFKDLGDGWHLYVISDGAGSAKWSQRGAKTNCEKAAQLIIKLLDKTGWKQSSTLPSEVEWHIQFDSICRAIKQQIINDIASLDEDITPRDYNATLMLLVVSQLGMLCGHIGDGRMGYMDDNAEWHSCMIPHKGEEANQTVFMMSEWDKPRVPVAKLSGVFIPETRVINSTPKRVVMMTDGCENFSWLCVGLDTETGKYIDRNMPFGEFLNPMFDAVAQCTMEERFTQYITFINQGNEACLSETDDRTMLIGQYGTLFENNQDSIEESDNSLSQD